MKLFTWLQDSDLQTESPHQEESEPPLSPALKQRLGELRSISVREIMIPRALITGLDVDVQLRRVRRLKSSKANYFPVYRGDLDHILGWIPKSKVIELLNENSEDARLEDFVRTVPIVLETQPVSNLVDLFLSTSSPFVIVRNEQGATTGILPLSELIELIFGFEMSPSLRQAGGEPATPPGGSYEL